MTTPRKPAGESDALAHGGDEGPSLEQAAYQALLDWLIQGHAKPGEMVPLRDFARRLGMSRTPLRAAAGRLHEQGLLSYNQRLGFTVAIPTAKDLYELFDLRLMLEQHALRRFLETSGGGVPPELPQLAADSFALVDLIESDPAKYQEFWRYDVRFHRAIVASGDSRRMLDWWDNLLVNIHVLQLGWTVPLTRERFQTSVREHAAIVDALVGGQGLRAVELLTHHITRVRNQAVDWAIRAVGPGTLIEEPSWLSRIQPSGKAPDSRG